VSFDRHVEPVYLWLEQAHVDYVNGFRAAKVAIEAAKAPKEVIKFLVDVRRGALSVRGKALTFIEASLDNNDLLVSVKTRSVLEFYASGRDYLYAATASSCNSWYSEYIRFVEISVDHFDGNCWDQDVFGNDAKNDLLFGIERTLDRLEISFRKVTHAYALARAHVS
jgi:hypothetical protein